MKKNMKDVAKLVAVGVAMAAGALLVPAWLVGLPVIVGVGLMAVVVGSSV